MSKDQAHTDIIDLLEPEDIPERKLEQQSVLEAAEKFRDDMKLAGEKSKDLSDLGLEFGGRVLLLGPPGTDFSAFVSHISTQVPIRLLRFRLEEAFDSVHKLPSMIRTAFEFAKRTSPAVLYVERLEFIAEKNTAHGAAFAQEIKNTSWDHDDILVVCQSTDPEIIDRGVLTLFNQSFVFDLASLDDRVRVLEQALTGHSDEASILAGLTEGWSFTDILKLASFLVRNPLEKEREYTKNELEKYIEHSGIVPLGRKEVIDSISTKTKGEYHPPTERVLSEYPDGFLDQLYLSAVGDDFLRAQQVIETLNANMPLSPEDRNFLSRYPFLLSGDSEERLTRLLRAKRSKDRLDRILGR